MITISGSQAFIGFIYLVASGLFILALKWMNAPPTARRGILSGEIGMVLAIGGTILQLGIEGKLEHLTIDYAWIFIALGIGTAIGIPLGLVQMTAVPQRTALSHAFGAFCVTLVGTAEYYLGVHGSGIPAFKMSVLCCEVILGGLTVTGSLMAAGKLQEVLPQRPITFKGQNIFNLSMLAAAIAIAVYLVHDPSATHLYPVMVGIALVFGVMLVIPIGGADMPTVISLLNSYAGLSASMMGFVLNNKLLIIAGALDGSSGLVLSIIMCRAMNRSFANVLFGQFDVSAAASADEVYGGKVKSASPEDIAVILDNAQRVVIVPGYGMAVSQAQHAVRDLYQLLESRGVEVEFAIHPVAGRMPGHMNVLLAEANVPYEQLKEMDEINGEFPSTDVALVVGANDVVNPAARNTQGSPIYGMPILNVDQAKNIVFMKRSMRPGFAGIDNELLYDPK